MAVVGTVLSVLRTVARVHLRQVCLVGCRYTHVRLIIIMRRRSVIVPSQQADIMGSTMHCASCQGIVLVRNISCRGCS
jgi:hypothetical protein